MEHPSRVVRDAVRIPERPRTSPLPGRDMDTLQATTPARPATAVSRKKDQFVGNEETMRASTPQTATQLFDRTNEVDNMTGQDREATHTDTQSSAPNGTSLRDSGYHSVHTAETDPLEKIAVDEGIVLESPQPTPALEPPQEDPHDAEAAVNLDKMMPQSRKRPRCRGSPEQQRANQGYPKSSDEVHHKQIPAQSAPRQRHGPVVSARPERVQFPQVIPDPIPAARRRTLYNATRRLSWAYRRAAAAGASDSRLDNLLCAAASCGNVAKARHLLWEGADVNGRRSVYAATPTMLALVGDHVEMMDLLLEYGGHFNQPVFVDGTCLEGFQAAGDRGPLQCVYRGQNATVSKAQACVAKLIKTGRRPRFEVQALGPDADTASLQDMQCSIAAGLGEDENDYLLIPWAIVQDFKLADLAHGIALCYAIEHDQVAMITRLLDHRMMVGHRGIPLRLAADQNRHVLLEVILRSSAEAVRVVGFDASILRSAAFGLREAAVDVLLRYSNSTQIQAVLQNAVAGARVAAVRMICAKTVVSGDDPLERKYQSRPIMGPEGLEVAGIQRMMLHCKSHHGLVSASRAFILLVSTRLDQRPAVCRMLLDAGAEEKVVLKALRMIGRPGSKEEAGEMSSVSPPVTAGDASIDERVMLAF